ncbi:hypothetical protein C8Q73DRAFT_365257 [Cubamyces lactineus]|nr:hypothetical protein C8Q73DRAFT_365257 [Cubamyces lactineus]
MRGCVYEASYGAPAGRDQLRFESRRRTTEGERGGAPGIDGRTGETGGLLRTVRMTEARRPTRSPPGTQCSHSSPLLSDHQRAPSAALNGTPPLCPTGTSFHARVSAAWARNASLGCIWDATPAKASRFPLVSSAVTHYRRVRRTFVLYRSFSASSDGVISGFVWVCGVCKITCCPLRPNTERDGAHPSPTNPCAPIARTKVRHHRACDVHSLSQSLV